MNGSVLDKVSKKLLPIRVGIRIHSFIVLCCLLAAPAFGVELNKPNERISETLIGFGRDPQKAESAVLALANDRAIDSDYRITGIGISSCSKDFYCKLVIEHKIYIDPDEKRTTQMTVGHGRDEEEALKNATHKAVQMIADGNRSLSVIGKDADNGAEQSHRSSSRRYWLKSISFTQLDGSWLCYIKFEYPIDKDLF